MQKAAGKPPAAVLSVSAEFRKLQPFVVLQGPVDAPLVGEQQQVAAFHVLNLPGVGGQAQLL